MKRIELPYDEEGDLDLDAIEKLITAPGYDESSDLGRRIHDALLKDRNKSKRAMRLYTRSNNEMLIGLITRHVAAVWGKGISRAVELLLRRRALTVKPSMDAYTSLFDALVSAAPKRGD